MEEKRGNEDSTLEKLLAKREEVSRHRPRFVRQESWRYARIKPAWRKPRGIDSKMRRQDKGWPALVRVGYRGPALVRGIHPSGHREHLVHTVPELEKLTPGADVARIGSTVGARKRALIIQRAKELGIRVLNPTGLRVVESKK